MAADAQPDPVFPGSAPREEVPIPGAESSLRLFEHLRQAVDAHAIMALTDARGVILHVNDKFCEIAKFRRDELLGQTHRLINSGHHPAEFWREFWQTILAGRVWHGEIRNRAKDGTVYWVDSTVTPIPGPDGKPQYFLSLRTDITRLKLVEDELGRMARDLERRVRERTAQLEQSERLYRLLLSSVTDYHYTVEVRDGAAFKTTHTPSCLAVTGYTVEEFQSQPQLWLAMVPPDDRPAVVAHAHAALEGLSLTPLEHRIVRQDGQVRWIRDKVVVRRDAEGRVVFYDGIITDITAEKHAQGEVQKLNQELEQRVADRTAQLKAAHDQLRVLFEHAPVGISWVEWGQPDVFHLNDRFCALIGLTREEAKSYENIVGATSPTDRPKQAALMAQLQRGERDSFTLRKCYVHRDGRTVWGDLTVVVLRDEHGRMTQQFAMLVDITDRMHAEEELRRSEQRFRRYVENASEILYSLDAAGVCTFVSPAWKAKLGHGWDQVVGRNFADFLHPDDRAAVLAFFETVKRAESADRAVEYRIRHQDGTWRWHASTGSVLRDDQGRPGFFGVGRDISVRRQAQDELRAALARREELERIVNRSPSVILLWSAREGWPVEFVSQSIAQFGYSPDEIVSGRTRFIDLMYPADAARVAEEVRAHAAAGHREYRQEYRMVTRAGAVRWIEDRTMVRTDAEGRVTHHEGILTDVTARKEVEERERLARERELQVAREVQQHLLPSVYPDISEAEIAALYTPSKWVGGDYYDFFPIDDRRWGFAIADVSGKGVAAALMMSSCRTALRVKAAGGWDPASVVRMVNYIVQPDMPRAMFISAVYGLLDLDTNMVSLSRAGHEPPLVIRATDGEVLTLCPAGMALGLDTGAAFDDCLEEQRIALQPQDLLVLYTDGITETADADGEEFGRHRLAEVLVKVRHEPLHAIRAAVDEALRAFAHDRPAADDRTLLLVRPR